jgi:hypothetical protein
MGTCPVWLAYLEQYRFAIPDAPIATPARFRRAHLSQMVNHLVQQGEDFVGLFSTGAAVSATVDACMAVVTLGAWLRTVNARCSHACSAPS